MARSSGEHEDRAVRDQGRRQAGYKDRAQKTSLGDAIG